MRNGSSNANCTVGSVEAPDGVRIFYEFAGEGEPTIVFVHGWSCDRSYWRAQMEHFARSHRVVAIDLCGHGESGLERKDWTMTAFGRDICAVVEELELGRVILVGHSMGGYIILEAAKLMLDRAIALVAVDIFENAERRWGAEELENYLAPMRVDFAKTTEARVRNYFPQRSDPKLVDWIAHDMAAAPSELATSVMESIRRYDQTGGLASVKVPMRLINSDLWTTDVEMARRYNPNIELAVMPGLGHFLMMEAPDEFNRLLERAVTELMASR